MKIICKTNLDLSHEIWPTELLTVPRVGDRIESGQIWDSGITLQLEVHAVTWEYEYTSRKWYPLIELHIPKGRGWSLKDFYEWYAPLVGRSVYSFIG